MGTPLQMHSRNRALGCPLPRGLRGPAPELADPAAQHGLPRQCPQSFRSGWYQDAGEEGSLVPCEGGEQTAVPSPRLSSVPGRI